MAEKYGVKETDFSILRTTGEDGKNTITVAYTAENGIDLGDPEKTYDKKRSWNGIFDRKNAKDFQVTIGRKKYDTRAGMTEDVYRAFIADAKANGVNLLPDSPQLAEKNGQVWTDTWLTGEKAVRGRAPIAYVNDDDQVNADWNHRDNDNRENRFRPAAVS